MESHLGLCACYRKRQKFGGAAQVARAAWRRPADEYVIEVEADSERLSSSAFSLAQHMSDLDLLKAPGNAPRGNVELL